VITISGHKTAGTGMEKAESRPPENGNRVTGIVSENAQFPKAESVIRLI